MGLEDDQRGTYQLSRISTDQPLMIGDPAIAKEQILSGKFVIEDFKVSELEVTGTSFDDEIVSFVPVNGGWIDEWFYSGMGNDLILAGGGRDQLLGGLGDVRLRGGTGHDVLLGELGDEHL